MAGNIHSSAVVEDGATIGSDVSIGPFCHVGSKVTIGQGSVLHSHAVLAGNTTIGKSARIFPFASIGHEPQDLKYGGEECFLEIGDNCLIREGVTMNPGTSGDNCITRVGNDCSFLANSHVAHDCIVGNNVIFANAVIVAGHCHIGDYTIFGGGAGVHQFTRIGNNAFVGGMAGIDSDVIPYGAALGNRAYLGGLNIVGMKRANVDRDSIHKARKAFKILFSSGKPILEALDDIDSDLEKDQVVKQITDFVRESGGRALCTPRTQK